MLAMVLLGFTLGAFYLQRFWLGQQKLYHRDRQGRRRRASALPRGLAIPVYAVVALWSAFTVVVYGMILYGSFVQLWGVDNTLTFKHYITAFAHRLERWRHPLDRLGLGQFLDHHA